ncbi:hypothetical protein GS688_07705 [Rhodococcus hoagii]|uniref:hypothetical protein n=1 Tax=Rhodococcus hoagii TaxID=43767 RepID=UPI000A11B55E|nr:hypothetical protein [Prescottella equi]NKT17581.1 hypothetical protein [Prescottella equi]ORL38318.1 hypothetical protein A6I87_02730 [Prescottella equi]
MPDNDFDDFDEFDHEPAPRERPRPNSNGGRKKRQRENRGRAGTTIPAHAPAPQDRLPKKPAQQSEVEDVELQITVFGEEFRVRRGALQDDWAFFQAQAVGNLPAMTVQVLGRTGFARFCLAAQAEGMKPIDAIKTLWDLIGQEVGVGDSGN